VAKTQELNPQDCNVRLVFIVILGSRKKTFVCHMNNQVKCKLI